MVLVHLLHEQPRDHLVEAGFPAIPPVAQIHLPLIRVILSHPRQTLADGHRASGRDWA